MNLSPIWLVLLLAWGTNESLPVSGRDEGIAARNAIEPSAAWWFVPDGRLPGRAGAEVQVPDSSRPAAPLIDIPTPPLRFQGQLPTQRQLDL